MKQWFWFADSRAPLSLDILAFILIGILPLLLLSWLLIKKKRLYRVHMALQLLLGLVLGLALLVFEVEIRLYGWRQHAELSPHYETWVMPSLILHLLFAIPAFVLWIVVIYGALRKYGVSPQPNRYSIIHKKMGRLAMVMMLGTGMTGWMFYYLAFIATT